MRPGGPKKSRYPIGDEVNCVDFVYTYVCMHVCIDTCAYSIERYIIRIVFYHNF